MRRIITWSIRGRHPWIVIAVWIVIAGALSMGPKLQSVTTNDASKGLSRQGREQARRRAAAGVVRRRQGHADHRRLQLGGAAHRRRQGGDRRRRGLAHERRRADQQRQRAVLPGRQGRAHLRQPERQPRATRPSATPCRRSATTSATPSTGMEVRVTGPGGLITDVYKIFLNADVKLLVGTVILVLVLLLLIYRSPVLPFVPLIAVGLRLLRRRRPPRPARHGSRRHALRAGDVAHGHPAVRRRDRLRPAAHLALPRGPASRARRPRGPGDRAGRDVGGHRRQRPHRDARRAHAALRAVRRLPLVRAGARARRLRHPHRRAHAHAGAARGARPPRLLAARAQGRATRPSTSTWERVAEWVAAGPRRAARASSPPSSSSWRSAASSTARASASPRTSSRTCRQARATRCWRSTSPRARWRRRRCSSRRRRRRPSSSPA